MWQNRYFLAWLYPPVPLTTPPAIPDETVPESDWPLVDPPETTVTFTTLADDVARRLGDETHTVWTDAEIRTYLEQGYQELALSTRCFWDMAYYTNQPDGLSVSQAWEDAVSSQHYGVANYTLEDERVLLTEAFRLGPANHTCPEEATDGWLADCEATAVSDAVVELPEDVIEVERVAWDGEALEATTPARAEQTDPHYLTTRGSVYGYLWRLDGPRSLRHVRIPSAPATAYEVEGAWGIARTVDDLSDDTVTGGWGTPRRIAGHHPVGGTTWGTPRMPWTDSLGTRVEYWRLGAHLGLDADVCELPARYTAYLRDYAVGQCHFRSGPGQDLTLAKWYMARYQRGLARLTSRMLSTSAARTGQLGEPLRVLGSRPARPRRPYTYPQDVR